MNKSIAKFRLPLYLHLPDEGLYHLRVNIQLPFICQLIFFQHKGLAESEVKSLEVVTSGGLLSTLSFLCIYFNPLSTAFSTPALARCCSEHQ